MSVTYVPADLRRLVRDRARSLCEYRQVPEAATFAFHQLDYIIAEKHGGKTSEDNLALCCTVCNRRKGTDLASIDPETGEVAPLFHPRQNRWSDHFRSEESRLVGLTPTGRTTIALLGLNHPARITERAALALSGTIRD